MTTETFTPAISNEDMLKMSAKWDHNGISWRMALACLTKDFDELKKMATDDPVVHIEMTECIIDLANALEGAHNLVKAAGTRLLMTASE